MRASRTRPTSLAALAAVALVATACSGGGRDRAVLRAEAATTTSTTAPTTTSSTAAPATTARPATTTTRRAGGGTASEASASLRSGSRGPAVQQLEQALAAQRYDPGRVDGVYDAMTAYAVTAFEKVWGLPRDGRAGPAVLAKLAGVGPPAPMLPGGGATRVEVDLKRQVLFFYRGGALEKIEPVSTGSGQRYCVDGQCDYAITPGGSFRVTRRVSGIRVSRLGKLWNPLYFNGGIAIHGEPAVPAYPASHGCVRVPMGASRYLFDAIPNGTPVYVLGGKKAPVPFNEPAPGEAPPNSSTTTAPATTTTAAPSTTQPTTTSTAHPPSTTSTTAPPTTTTSTTPPPTTTTP